MRRAVEKPTITAEERKRAIAYFAKKDPGYNSYYTRLALDNPTTRVANRLVDEYNGIREAVIWRRKRMAVVVVVTLGIAFGVAFGTSKTTTGRTVGIAGVILSSEVFLLMVPISFVLVLGSVLGYNDDSLFMGIKVTNKYLLATLVWATLLAWPVFFLGATALTIYAAVKLIK